MEFIGTSKAAEITGFAQSTIERWCREGKIKGAEQDGFGKPWRIPIDTKLPIKK